MARVIVSTQNIYTVWKFPEQLLSVEDNNQNRAGPERPWSWAIRYNTLTYYDDKGKEHQIEGREQEPEGKWHEDDDLEIQDAEDWDHLISDSEED